MSDKSGIDPFWARENKKEELHPIWVRILFWGLIFIMFLWAISAYFLPEVSYETFESMYEMLIEKIGQCC
ncbi:hypothetical protein GW765_01485 [Candidatus Parcubacteria bacterium]|nr:hypothetical protein [Candidatus Parcubacteria bacterium]